MHREGFMCLTPFKLECLLPLKTCVKENNVNSKWMCSGVSRDTEVYLQITKIVKNEWSDEYKL